MPFNLVENIVKYIENSSSLKLTVVLIFIYSTMNMHLRHIKETNEMKLINDADKYIEFKRSTLNITEFKDLINTFFDRLNQSQKLGLENKLLNMHEDK